MKATKQAKIFSTARTPLETVIPRDTPFSIEVDIASVCNLKCKFCFHSDVEKINESGIRFGIMDMPLYKKIIDDIGKFPQKPAKLKLFEFGEPLMNRKMPEMIRYAREKDVVRSIETVTNGTLLNKILNRELVDAGLSRINISVESLSDNGYEKVAGIKLNFNEYVENIRDFYKNRGNCFVYIKLIDLGDLTETEKDFFYDTFGDISDEIFIENVAPVWKGTIANELTISTVGSYGQPLKYKYVCPFIFTRMIVNHDGTVALCCTDWQRKELIGDAKDESLYDIWNGERLHSIQIKHLRGERESIPLCEGCTTLSTSTIDDVDEYRLEILERVDR
ncbi:MAG: radical SAM/SPASM domain-containing protein [Caulobacteraceae bacterium]